MKGLFVLLLVVVCAFPAVSQRPRRNVVALSDIPARRAASPMTASLPIRRVILYSNGVAYIERRGTVTGNAEVNLSFKQSQVDDVLKSMVVLDLNNGKIGAVSYNSSAPASARMSEIPFSVEPVSAEGSGIAGVLAQLQGSKVAVAAGKGVVIGSVLTVEKKMVRSEKETYTTNFLVIAGDNGEISTFDLRDVRSVKLLDEETQTDIRDFANATASARRLDAKTITVTSEGTGTRQMVVSYTIAAPIWKTTYRVVLDKAGKPFFQGWAIVDNISDEDWDGVEMSLVSGSPISFIQNLQKPFYRYRPVIPTPADLQLEPQIYEPSGFGEGSRFGDSDTAGANELAGTMVDPSGAVIPGVSVTIRNEVTGQSFSTVSDGSGRFSRSGLPAGTYTVTANASGFNTVNVRNARPGRNLNIQMEPGSVSSTVEVTAQELEELHANGRNFSSMAGQRSMPGMFQMDGVQKTVSEALTSGKSGVKSAATGDEIGDLFEYKIERPVTVMRNRSALIPIVQTQMEGERVAIYNEATRRDRPFSGVLLKNTTSLTLESGSLTVIDGNAYAGEALMERLKAKEQRLISFALDLGTSIVVRPVQNREPARLVKASNGVFQVHYFTTEEKVYSITNQTDRPKTVFIEYPVRFGWELSDKSPKPDYTTQSFYRFRVELKGFEEKDVTISLRRPLVDTYQIGSINQDQVAMFVAQGYISEETRPKLEKLISLRTQIHELDMRLRGFDEETRKIGEDQRRLRENIESLSKTAEAKTLIARYIAKAGEQETRLEEIEKERKTIAAEKERLARQLSVEVMTFEIK